MFLLETFYPEESVWMHVAYRLQTLLYYCDRPIASCVLGAVYQHYAYPF